MPGLIQVDGLKYLTFKGAKILQEMPQRLPAGKVDFITLHWTAGNYGQGFNDYQVLVSNDEAWLSVDPLRWSAHQHTYAANTRNIGVSLMCMAPGQPPTPAMVERAAAAVACLRQAYNLGSKHIKDHGQWAKEMGYWPDRVDVQTFKCGWVDNAPLDMVIRDKAAWYLNKLKTGG